MQKRSLSHQLTT